MKHTYISAIILFASIIFINCRFLKHTNEHPFTIKDASYMSWMAGSKEKGTQVTIVLKDIASHVKFDSIIFKGIKLSVRDSISEHTTILRATYIASSTVLKQPYEVAQGPDRLLYQYQGKKASCEIKNIRREKMRYK